MASRAALRASDADRDRVMERLRRAAAEGRLRTEELEQRVEAALSARTYGQLDALLSDLPGPGLVARRGGRPLAWVPPALALAIAIPVAVAVIAAAVFVVTGMLALWWVWLIVGWCIVGQRRHRAHSRHYGRASRDYASRTFWA